MENDMLIKIEIEKRKYSVVDFTSYDYLQSADVNACILRGINDVGVMMISVFNS